MEPFGFICQGQILIFNEQFSKIFIQLSILKNILHSQKKHLDILCGLCYAYIGFDCGGAPMRISYKKTLAFAS
jgi:hypothetical protein